MPRKGIGRLAHRIILSAAALLIDAGASAMAGDLTGMTLRADGIIEATSERSSANNDFTFPLEIYFGSKGTRFVTMAGISGNVRVVIKAGEDRGLKRRKDGKFTYEVKIQQTASTVQVKILSRGADMRYANDSWAFEIGVGSGSCKTNKFRYTPDPEVYLAVGDHRLLRVNKVASKPGACIITSGAPEGLADE